MTAGAPRPAAAADGAPRAADLFAQAIGLEPEARRAFLQDRCPDQALRAEIESLIGHHEAAGPAFLKPTTISRIGPYHILGVLGEGGFGVVYLAQQEEPLRRRVAVKALKLGLDTEQIVARFALERQALSMMDHPTVARALDAGATEQGRPYFVMEHVPGVPITDYCDRRGLGMRERIALMIPVCDAVQHAHMKGIIHRDLKPSNILVDDRAGPPTPKVIDFGIAKAVGLAGGGATLYTEPGRVVGTPEYASPEQLDGAGLDIDTRTDVYSLGVILCQLLAGRLPRESGAVRGGDPGSAAVAARSAPMPRPSALAATPRSRSGPPAPPGPTWARQLRGEPDWIILKALEPDRTRRYATAAELGAELDRYLRGLPVLAGPPGALYRVRRFAGRHRAAVGAAGAILAALVLGLGAAVYGLTQARSERQEALRQSQTAAAVVDFVNQDLLGSVDPRTALAHDITVREALDRAGASVEHKFGGRPLVEAATRHTIGSLYRRLGRLQDARPHLERALSLRRSALGDDDPDTLESMRALAILDEDQGRFAEAESSFAALLAAQQRLRGADHEATITAAMDLAVVYDRRGRAADSTDLVARTLETARRVLGRQHPKTLLIQNNLAWSLQLQGRYDEARALAEPAAEDGERILGPDDPTYQHFRNTLAVILFKQGHLAEAESLHLRTLDARTRVLGADHPDTLTSQVNLARVYRAQSRIDESRALFTHALDAQRRILGEDHPDTRRIAAELAELGSAK